MGNNIGHSLLYTSDPILQIYSAYKIIEVIFAKNMWDFSEGQYGGKFAKKYKNRRSGENIQQLHH